MFSPCEKARDSVVLNDDDLQEQEGAEAYKGFEECVYALALARVAGGGWGFSLSVRRD